MQGLKPLVLWKQILLLAWVINPVLLVHLETISLVVEMTKRVECPQTKMGGYVLSEKLRGINCCIVMIEVGCQSLTVRAYFPSKSVIEVTESTSWTILQISWLVERR